MYLSKIEIRPDGANDPLLWRRLSEPYEFHRLLWDCFSDGPERNRDFIYRQEGRQAYSISQRPPHKPGPGWRVEQKTFSPRLKAGDHLRFILRANPVVSRRDDNGKQHRCDLVMDAKTSLKKQGVPREKWPSQAEMARDAGLAWMRAREKANGYKLHEESFTAEGYRQLRFPKKGHRVSIAVLDLGGLLEVSQPERFVAMLSKGLGPAKGFGCGLMLVKRA